MLSENKGKLWLVGMPIGNALDLSPRAKQCLENADLILAEDTRRAYLTCKRLEINAKDFISLHDNNESERLNYVLELLSQGKTLALISDAGMPCIADPGFLLVKACRQANYFVSVVPGANAALTALASSGIAPQPFTFFGFLPRKKGEIIKLFTPYLQLHNTLIFFERKDRLAKTIELALQVLGDRELCLARELTKSYEEILVSTLAKPSLPENLLGEFTVIIGQALEKTCSSKESLEQLIQIESKNSNLSPKQLAKKIATSSYGWSTSDIYDLIIKK